MKIRAKERVTWLFKRIFFKILPLAVDPGGKNLRRKKTEKMQGICLGNN